MCKETHQGMKGLGKRYHDDALEGFEGIMLSLFLMCMSFFTIQKSKANKRVKLAHRFIQKKVK
mgnify:CR=1 FL=1